MARRNRGIHKPEHRLIVLVIPAVLRHGHVVIVRLHSHRVIFLVGASFGLHLLFFGLGLCSHCVDYICVGIDSEASRSGLGDGCGYKEHCLIRLHIRIDSSGGERGIFVRVWVPAGVLGACFILECTDLRTQPEVARAYTGRMERRRGVTPTD